MTPLADQLATLGLRYTAAHLDDVVALATKRRWSISSSANSRSAPVAASSAGSPAAVSAASSR